MSNFHLSCQESLSLQSPTITSDDMTPASYILALNDLAAELILASFYAEAMECLKEAIELMRMFVKTSGFNGKVERIKIEELRRKHAITRQMLASTNQTAASETHFTPLTIDFAELRDPIDVDILSAVVLYNFGLVHRLMSTTQENQVHLAEGALRLYTMAYNILSQRSTLASMNPQDMSETRLHLLIVVLHSLVHMNQLLGKFEEASQHLEFLMRLGTQVGESSPEQPAQTNLSRAANEWYIELDSCAPAA